MWYSRDYWHSGTLEIQFFGKRRDYCSPPSAASEASEPPRRLLPFRSMMSMGSCVFVSFGRFWSLQKWTFRQLGAK